MAKKEPKFKIEPQHSETLGPYWLIWVMDHDIMLHSEEQAKLVCDALNAFDGIKKLKRKAGELESILQHFNAED